MRFEVGKLSQMGIFIALAIALKLPILQIPNVEFFTFVVFSSGYLLGKKEGSMVGGLSMLLYTTFNPYGLPPLPIGVAQVFSMLLIGFFGGVVCQMNLIKFPKVSAFVIMSFFGLGLTLMYDLLTNLATAYVMGQFIPVMIAGIPFALIHIGSNTLIFVVLTPLLSKMEKFQKRC